MEKVQRYTSISVISFFTALLIFTANHTQKKVDLLDVIIDNISAKTELIQAQKGE